MRIILFHNDLHWSDPVMDNIRYTKHIFDKALRASVTKYKKRLKIYKNKQEIAKQQIKNNKIRALRNDSTIDVRKPDRLKKVIKY